MGLLLIYNMDVAKVLVDIEKKSKQLAEDPFFDRLYTGKALPSDYIVDGDIYKDDNYNPDRGVFEL